MLIADNQGPAIILKCARQDLRSRGAEAVNQNYHRTGIFNPVVLVTQNPFLAGTIADLDHRSGIDKQPSDADSIGQGPAAIVAQIKNQAGDILLAQPAKLLPQIVGTVAVCLTAVVAVERRYLDIAKGLAALLI